VVAGELGGRRLDTPGGDGSRPSTDRVREAVFNALESLDAVAGATVLDAFAGSGALGIEALSRGAARAVFAEVAPAALEVVATNLSTLGLTSRAEVRRGDGPAAAAAGRWDLVLLDPPYGFDGWPGLLAVVRDRLEPGGVVVVESDREIEVPDGLMVLRTRRYGGTVVRFLTHPGAVA